MSLRSRFVAASMALVGGVAAPSLLVAPASLAQDQPNRRAVLEQLSSALGEAHAIRSLCNGEDDQTWRNYMLELQTLEAPDGADKAQLTRAFNNGYKRQRGQHAACTPDLLEVESEIAARGRALAETVARTYLR